MLKDGLAAKFRLRGLSSSILLELRCTSDCFCEPVCERVVPPEPLLHVERVESEHSSRAPLHQLHHPSE